MIGYAPGTLYNAFENLGDIVLRVEVKMLEELDGSLRSAIGEATGREAVKRFARAYLSFAHERVRLWRLFNDHRPDGQMSVPVWYSDAVTSVTSQLEGPLGSLMPDAGSPDVAVATRALWAAIHGLAVNSTCGKMGCMSLEQAQLHQEQFLDVYLDGLAAGASKAGGIDRHTRNRGHAA